MLDIFSNVFVVCLFIFFKNNIFKKISLEYYTRVPNTLGVKFKLYILSGNILCISVHSLLSLLLPELESVFLRFSFWEFSFIVQIMLN